jgi:hypothetical protein
MHVFRLEGEYWTVEYEGVVIRLRDSKGLRYLAYLLRHPGMEIGAAELIGRVSGVGDRVSPGSRSNTRHPTPDTHLQPDTRDERARSAVSKRIRDALKKIRDHHPSLGRYLIVTVRTGQTCAYVPDPAEPITWTS